MKTNMYFVSYLTRLFSEWKMFRTKFVQKILTHVVGSMTFFFFKSCHLWDNIEKYSWARQAADENMIHADCMLDT